MGHAVVGVHQAILAICGIGPWCLVPVGLVGTGEVELAHLGEILPLVVVHQERIPRIQGGQIVKVLVRFC